MKKIIISGILILSMLIIVIGSTLQDWKVEEPKVVEATGPTLSFNRRTTFHEYVEIAKSMEGMERPQGTALINIALAVISPCPPELQGNCSFEIEVLGPEDWAAEKEEVVAFYIGLPAEEGMLYRGPFIDRLYRLVEEMDESGLEEQKAWGKGFTLPSNRINPVQSGRSFSYYMDTRLDFDTGEPKGMEIIYTAEGVIAPCPPNPDGVCGGDIDILGPKGWTMEAGGIHTFYLRNESGTGTNFYGPFTDELGRIAKEAQAASENALAPVEGKSESFSYYMENKRISKTGKPAEISSAYIAKDVYNPCSTPGMDGVCGNDIHILASEDWESKIGQQIFYLMQETQQGWDYFGPFRDDLHRIVREAKEMAEAERIAWEKMMSDRAQGAQ